MITIEQIDEFRKRTNSSYEDAKYFLMRNNGDILEAIIDFERTKTGRQGAGHGYQNERHGSSQGSFSEKKEDYGRKFSDILQKGFDTRIYVEDRNSVLFSIPVIFLLVLLPLWFLILIMFVFFVMLGYKISVRDTKNPNVNVNDFFQNISEKMKETGGTKREAQQKPPQPPVRSNIDVPEVKKESGVPDKAGNGNKKDDGYKEYTIE